MNVEANTDRRHTSIAQVLVNVGTISGLGRRWRGGCSSALGGKGKEEKIRVSSKRLQNRLDHTFIYLQFLAAFCSIVIGSVDRRRRRCRSYKVRQSYISRTFRPVITKLYKNLHTRQIYNHTGYDVTNYFRSEATAKKTKMPPHTASGGISRDRFVRGSPNFARLSWIADPTNLLFDWWGSLLEIRQQRKRKIRRRFCRYSRSFGSVSVTTLQTFARDRPSCLHIATGNDITRYFRSSANHFYEFKNSRFQVTISQQLLNQFGKRLSWKTSIDLLHFFAFSCH